MTYPHAEQVNKAKLALQAAKNKKRKFAALRKSKSKDNGAVSSNSGGRIAGARYAEANEVVTSCSAVLDAVRIACTHDTSQTVDEDRYSSMMPAVVNLMVQILPFFMFIESGTDTSGSAASRT